MLSKKLLPAAVTAAALLGAGQAMADDAIVTGDEYQGFTANVTLTSDYRFRGISQSDESVAIQGGFDYAWDNGIYIGTWGSSVDFDDDGSLGSLELDYYIGWAFDITDNFSLDVGYLYYDYPGDDGNSEGDYQEIYGSATWFGVTAGVHYSDDYYAETDTFWYYYAAYSLGLFDDFLTLDFHIGYNDLEKAEFDEDGNWVSGFLETDEDSYIDYSVAATISQWGLDWSIAWVGTDLDDDDVFGTDWADDTVVFSVSRSM